MDDQATSGVTATLDANVLIRHFTGQPPDLASRATLYLKAAAPSSLLLPDVQTSELVYVLESFYEQTRDVISTALHATLGLPAVIVEHDRRIRRALTAYGDRGMDWPDAYLVAATEDRGLSAIVSFDRFDTKLKGLPVRRLEP